MWLVSDGSEEIDKIVAAIGNMPDDDADVTSSTDYEILRAARTLALSFDAAVHPVNAYQVPAPEALAVNVAGVAAARSWLPRPGKRCASQSATSTRTLWAALGQMFLIDPDNIHVREGHPGRRDPHRCRRTLRRHWSLLVPSSIGRFERMISDVTVEPVIARSDADILIVRDPL